MSATTIPNNHNIVDLIAQTSAGKNQTKDATNSRLVSWANANVKPLLSATLTMEDLNYFLDSWGAKIIKYHDNNTHHLATISIPANWSWSTEAKADNKPDTAVTTQHYKIDPFLNILLPTPSDTDTDRLTDDRQRVAKFDFDQEEISNAMQDWQRPTKPVPPLMPSNFAK